MPDQDLLSLVHEHRWPVVAGVVIWCLVRLLKSDVASTPTIPDRWRPLASLGLGVISGIGDALIAGTPWLTALLGGIVAGLAPVAGNEVVAEGLLGKRTQAIECLKAQVRAASARRDPAPPTPRRPSGGSALLMALAFVGVIGFAGCVSSCSAALPVAEVASVVIQTTALANTVLGQVATFSDAYFAEHPDPKREAEVLAALKRAQDAAGELGALADGVRAVTEGDILRALADFRGAYADLLAAVGKLPGASVVTVTTPGPALVAARLDTMTLVVPPPSAFDPKRGAR